MRGLLRACAWRDLAPDAPAIAEPSTGLTMGQSAEKMARENGITREEQDLIAYQSHQKTADATDDGRLGRELIPVLAPPRYEPAVIADNLLRRDTTMEALAALPPVFDRRYGTVTAGNSSPLTDGAAAVDPHVGGRGARREGMEPLAFIRSRGPSPPWIPAASCSWGRRSRSRRRWSARG